MKLSKVTGTVVSTIKYERYQGHKLLKIRHLNLEGCMVGDEMVAIDMADAGVGDIVLTNFDGGAAKMITGDKEIIAGLTICGVVDSYTWQGQTIRCS